MGSKPNWNGTFDAVYSFRLCKSPLKPQFQAKSDFSTGDFSNVLAKQEDRVYLQSWTQLSTSSTIHRHEDIRAVGLMRAYLKNQWLPSVLSAN